MEFYSCIIYAIVRLLLEHVHTCPSAVFPHGCQVMRSTATDWWLKLTAEKSARVCALPVSYYTIYTISSPIPTSHVLDLVSDNHLWPRPHFFRNNQAYTYLDLDYGKDGRKRGSACFGFSGNVTPTGTLSWLSSRKVPAETGALRTMT